MVVVVVVVVVVIMVVVVVVMVEVVVVMVAHLARVGFPSVAGPERREREGSDPDTVL